MGDIGDMGHAGNGVVRLIGVRDQPLSVDEVLAAIEDDAGGGVNLFIGRVRDHDASRGVTSLDYSAHPTAERALGEVCAEIASRFAGDGVHAVAAVHRIGLLEVGDVAVIVGVCASHRDAAYAASRDLIDTLKSRVPIWKHQRFDDGGEEWVDHA